MSTPAKRLATYADILALDPLLTGEILNGDLFASPRPATAHAFAASTLGADLATAFMRGRGGPGGWWIIDEPEVHLGPNVVVPDLAGWRKERLPRPPVNEAFISLAPDWVCEVLRPRTAGTDRVRKLPIYGEFGVSRVWLLDPVARTIEAFKRSSDTWVLLGTYTGDDAVAIEPFDAVLLELRALWEASPPVDAA